MPRLSVEYVLNPKKRESIDVIKLVPVFSDLTVPQLAKLCDLLHSRQYYRNEIIFQEKEPGACMYIVKSGSVRLFSRTNGDETEVGRLEVGEFFGEGALIEEENRCVTAMAAEETELLGFFRGDLLNLINRDPRMASNILFNLSVLLSNRVQHLYDRLRQRDD